MSQLAVHLTQAASAVLMALVLLALHRRFRQPYVALWGLSFAALALHVFGMVAATWARSRWEWPVVAPSMIALTLCYTSAGVLQVLALVAGVFELRRPRGEAHAAGSRWPVLCLVALVVGAMLTLPWATDPQVNLDRLFLRTGTRYLLGGIVLAWVALSILQHHEDDNFGRRLTGAVLVLYATELLVQGVVAIPLLWGEMSPALRLVTPVHGLFEVVVYPMLGLGLVTWLLTNEHQRLDEAEARLQAVGRTDPVTGLANERGLVEELSEQTQSSSILALLGLDQFQLINEARGMGGGDDVLRRVSQHFRRELSNARALARLGGDEFVVVMPPGSASIAQLERARAGLARGVGGADQSLLAASLGWTRMSGLADLRSALQRASAALRECKRMGGRCALEYAERMAEAQRDWIVLSAELEQAFEHDEFQLYLQPLVSAHKARLLGFEALVRWRHPRLGMLAPDQFLPSLRTLRQMQRLDGLVLEQAIGLLRDQGSAAVPIAVNLGADGLLSSGTVELVAALLQRHGVSPALLHIEVTEETAIRSLDQGVQVLQQLDRLGVEIALDDFGTGYSSLSYLTRFPARRIKFDRQFLASAESDSASHSVLEALIPLAKRLGLRTVAEGIESIRQRELAERLGFDELQGYLFGRPLPAPEALASALRGALRSVESKHGP